MRGWHVDGLAVRPDHRMVGHTGFLMTARRMAPGVKPPARRTRPAKGSRPAAAHRPAAEAPAQAGGPPMTEPSSERHVDAFAGALLGGVDHLELQRFRDVDLGTDGGLQLAVGALDVGQPVDVELEDRRRRTARRARRRCTCPDRRERAYVDASNSGAIGCTRAAKALRERSKAVTPAASAARMVSPLTRAGRLV